MHALVVGGTGMLKPVVRYLIEQGWFVSVIAQHEESLISLRRELGDQAKNFSGLALNYADNSNLKKSLQSLSTTHGQIRLTIAWIHSHAPQALIAVAHHTAGDLFHVRSAGISQTTLKDPFDVSNVQNMDNITYYRIILGFKIENNNSRWLSNAEIAQGVISALQTKQSSVVGVVEPWNQRPC